MEGQSGGGTMKRREGGRAVGRSRLLYLAWGWARRMGGEDGHARVAGWRGEARTRRGSQHLFLPPINFEIDSSIDKNDAFCFEAGFLSVVRQVISTAD